MRQRAKLCGVAFARKVPEVATRAVAQNRNEPRPVGPNEAALLITAVRWKIDALTASLVSKYYYAFWRLVTGR
jgi:hypothetical protein